MLVSVDKTHKGTYGHIHCLTCGIVWTEHTAECSRHAYIPAEFRQAEIDPAILERIDANILGWTTGRNGTAETARAAR